jgi:hypothetical protein
LLKMLVSTLSGRKAAVAASGAGTLMAGGCLARDERWRM